MNLTSFTAILLGITEGLTEFLPISSTGHLILVSSLIKLKSTSLETFEVFIQLGAILAVVILYSDRFKALLNFQPNQTNEFKGMVGLTKIGLGCLPAFVIGFLVHGFIKEKLFSVLTVSIALIVGGAVMIFIEKRKINFGNFFNSDRKIKLSESSNFESITYKDSFLIGCFQLLALCPGVSRSAATIIGGMLIGLPRGLAAEFSFILAVPVIAVAAGYDLLKGYQELSSADILPFSIGLITSFVVALIAIKGFVKFLQKNDFVGFGIYRIFVGVAFLVFVA